VETTLILANVLMGNKRNKFFRLNLKGPVASLFFTLTLFFYISQAHATEAYDFMKDSIESLSQVCDVIERSSSQDNHLSGSDFGAQLQEILHNTLDAQGYLQDIELAVKSRKAYKNRAFSDGSDALLLALQSVDLALDKEADLVEKALNNPNFTQQDRGTAMRELYNASNIFGNSYENLVRASILIAMAVQDDKRLVDGKTHYLLITSDERKELRSMLLKAYGEQIRGQPTDNINPASGPGYILWRAIDDKWACADDK